MKGLEDYIIPLTGQKLGEQKLKFEMNDTFIQVFEDDDIMGCDIDAEAVLKRNNLTFEFDFKLKGNIQVACDRCLEPVKIKVKHKAILVVKIADQYEEINDELITITEDHSDFDLAPIFYEYLKLSIPIRKVHKKGECDPNMINILDQFAPEEETNDPRWDDLKKLLNKN